MNDFPKNYFVHLLEQIRTNTIIGVLSGVIAVVSVPATLMLPRSAVKFYFCLVGACASVAAKRYLGFRFELQDTLIDMKNVGYREQLEWYGSKLRASNTPKATTLAPAEEKVTQTVPDFVEYWESKDKHLMIVGGTGDGKSTLIKGLLQELMGYRATAYDVDYVIGDYPDGVDVVYTTEAINEAMQRDIEALNERVSQRREAGKGGFNACPRLIIAEELPSLVSDCKAEPEWIRLIAKRGRKVKMFLACCVQNDTIENTGLKGDNSLRDSCFVRVYLGKFALEQARKLNRFDLEIWLKEQPHGRFIVDDLPCEWYIQGS